MEDPAPEPTPAVSTEATPGPPIDGGSPVELPHGAEITAGTLHLRPFHAYDPLPPGVVAGAEAPDRLDLAVTHATTGEVLGAVRLQVLSGTRPECSLAVTTRPGAGREVAPQAIGTCARFAFGALGLVRLEIEHLPATDW